MADLLHPTFQQPCDRSVSVWRYMDLSKFAALLQLRALVFARADVLGDPFEGSVPLPSAGHTAEVLRMRRADPPVDLYPGLTDGQVDDMCRQGQRARLAMLRSTHVNCWHMNEGESAAMWTLYSKSCDAVCIRTDYQTLADCLPHNIIMGPVRYVDFNASNVDFRNAFAPFALKRRSFAHENEVRAIMSTFDKPGPPVIAVSVDLEALVRDIYVSPQSPPWFLEVVARLTATYGLSICVQQSELNSKPLY